MARMQIRRGMDYLTVTLLIILAVAALSNSTKTGKSESMNPLATTLTSAKPTTERRSQQNDIAWGETENEQLQKMKLHDQFTELNKRPNLGGGMEYIGLGKRTADAMHNSLKYIGLGKRLTDSLGSGLQYVGLGKRSKGSMGAGLQYIGLGKRPRDSMRGSLQYVGLGKRPTARSGLQYVGLGKRPTGTMGAGLQYVGLGKRPARNVGAGLQYVGLRKRLSQQEIRRYSTQIIDSKHQLKDTSKRGHSNARVNSGLYYAGIGRRGMDPGMLYAGIGKRSRRDTYRPRRRTLLDINAAMQYAGLGKRPWAGVDAAMLFAGIGKRSERRRDDGSYWNRRLLQITKNPRLVNSRRYTKAGTYDTLVNVLEEKLRMDFDKILRANSNWPISRDNFDNKMRFILSAMRAELLPYSDIQRPVHSKRGRTENDMNLAMQYTGIGKRKTAQESRIYSPTDEQIDMLHSNRDARKRSSGIDIRKSYRAGAAIDPAFALTGLGKK